jgi:hypothetical protein
MAEVLELALVPLKQTFQGKLRFQTQLVLL